MKFGAQDRQSPRAVASKKGSTMQTEYNLKAPKGQVSAALNLARAGIPVFPVDTKKHPLVKWKGAATIDEAQICKWWKRWPEAMPAFPTGEPSGIAVLDLDRKDGKDGVEAYWSEKNLLSLDGKDTGMGGSV